MALKPWVLVRLFAAEMWQEEDVNKQATSEKQICFASYLESQSWAENVSPTPDSISNTSNLNFTHFSMHTSVVCFYFFIPTVFGMSGSWEGKTNVHLRQHFILLCFGPETVLCTFQTQICI